MSRSSQASPPSADKGRDWREIATAAVLVAVLLYWAVPHLPDWGIALVSAGLAAALVYVLRPAWHWLFGPVFVYDLIRTTRKGRHVLFRCLYAGALLIALAIFVAIEFGAAWDHLFEWRTVSTRDRNLNEIATRFFAAFFIAQQCAVLLLAPVYTAGALIEEKEHGTLELLLATDLTSREIVLGKLASRTANMLLLLLTGLPILALTQLLGGIDPNLVLLGFAFSILWVVSLSSVALLVSTYARSSLGALGGTYAWVVLPGACCCAINPAWLQSDSRELLQLLGLMGLLYGLVIVAASYGTIQRLERLRKAEPRGRSRTADRPSAVGEAVAGMLAAVVPADRPASPLRPTDWFRPPVFDRAMLWKELHAGPRFRLQNLSTLAMGLVLIVWMVLGIGLLVSVLTALAIGRLPEAIVAVLQLTGAGCVSLALLVVGHYAAGRISHEREEGTLDLLLLTPLSRSEILHAKWLGSLYSARQFAWLLGIIWLGGTLLMGLNILSLPLLLLASAVFAAFTAWLGLFCSVICRTTVRATLWTLGVLAAILIAPLALGIRELAGFSPIASLAVLTFGYNRIPAAQELEQVLAWLIVYALATFFLWGATNVVFRRR